MQINATVKNFRDSYSNMMKIKQTPSASKHGIFISKTQIFPLSFTSILYVMLILNYMPYSNQKSEECEVLAEQTIPKICFFCRFLYRFIFDHRNWTSPDELCMQNIFDLGFSISDFIKFMLTVSTAEIVSMALLWKLLHLMLDQ